MRKISMAGPLFAVVLMDIAFMVLVSMLSPMDWTDRPRNYASIILSFLDTTSTVALRYLVGPNISIVLTLRECRCLGSVEI